MAQKTTNNGKAEEAQNFGHNLNKKICKLHAAIPAGPGEAKRSEGNRKIPKYLYT